MKKVLLISLITVLAVALVGCNNNEDISVNNPNTIVNSGDNNLENSNNENNNNETLGNNSGDNAIENNPADNETSGGDETFEEEPIVVSELEGKINTLIQNSGVMIRMPMAMPIESEAAFTYIGLDQDTFNSNVKDAISYESMIMPANQSVCLIELNDQADVANIKQKVIDNCDPNKWICMSADKCLAIDSGKYIMLVMSTAEDCDALQKAFEAEFGSAGTALTK